MTSTCSGHVQRAVDLPSGLNANATNTVTFDGGTGNAATRIITFNVTSAYEASSHSTAPIISASEPDGKFDHASNGYCFLFTNQADYNEISNCVLNLPVNTTSSYHIGIVANSTSSYSSSATGRTTM